MTDFEFGMMKSDFFLGPDRDLTKDEIQALLHVKARMRVSEMGLAKLQMAALSSAAFYRWSSTRAGDFGWPPGNQMPLAPTR